MNIIHLQFVKHVAKAANGNAYAAMAILVDAIAKGNTGFVESICRLLGHKNNLVRTAESIVRM